MTALSTLLFKYCGVLFYIYFRGGEGMKNEIVAVIGCGGLIGSMVVEKLLEKGIEVRGGQRRRPNKRIIDEKFQWVQLDIYKEEQLRNFCKGCRVILNCAGPSYEIKEKVAIAAIKENVIYVDLSDSVMCNEDVVSRLRNKGIIIVGTGYVPGISGAILNLISEEFDSVEKVQGFQSGRQYSTEIAFADVILSSIANAGYPDTYMKNGKMYRENVDPNIRRIIPGFPETVYLKSYLSHEIIDVAMNLNIQEIHWYNSLPDKKLMDTIIKFYRQISNLSTFEILQTYRQEFGSNFENGSSKDNWSVLLLEVYGYIKEKKVRRRYILNVNDSNYLCGEMATYTVCKVMEKGLQKGVYWANSIFNNNEVSNLISNLLGISFSSIQIPASSCDILEMNYETDYV